MRMAVADLVGSYVYILGDACGNNRPVTVPRNLSSGDNECLLNPIDPTEF